MMPLKGQIHEEGKLVGQGKKVESCGLSDGAFGQLAMTERGKGRASIAMPLQIVRLTDAEVPGRDVLLVQQLPILIEDDHHVIVMLQEVHCDGVALLQ